METNEKKKNNKKISRFEAVVFLILFFLAAIPLLYVWSHRTLLDQKPFYSLESTSELSFGSEGRTLVIDNGKKTLLVLDAEDRLIRRYEGGTSHTPFFYVCHAAQTSDGSIYIADISYGIRGNLLESERIIRLNGSRREVLYQIDYTQAAKEDTPLQYGRILELQEYEDEIYFVLDDRKSLKVQKINADGSVAEVADIPADGVKTDASFDIETGTLAVIYRIGTIELYNISGQLSPKQVREQGGVPFDICARNGQVYYTDLTDFSIKHFSIAEPERTTVFYESEDLSYYKLDVSKDEETILATDYAGFYRFEVTSDHLSSAPFYVDAAKVSFYSRVLFTWAMLILGILVFFIFIGRLLFWIGILVSRNENAMRVMLIVVACLAVFFIVSYLFLSRLMSTSTQFIEKQTHLFAEMLLLNIDQDSLEELDNPEDYSSDAYKRIKEPLDKKTWEYYESGDYYYYIIYRVLNGNVSYIMDFEDTMPVSYPVYEDNPEDNEYARVLHTGEEIQVSEISSYGAWTFQLTPVYDKEGNIVAELEVGRSLDALTHSQNELRWELMINAAVSTVVLTMLLLELTFLISFFQNKSSWIYLDQADLVPVRTLVFISYLADSMQDAFIAILCSQLYHGGLPVPDSVAIALPMSAQLLMMAVFSFFAGRLTERFGSRKVISLGMFVQLSGFLCCVAWANYSSILVGKMLIGSGMGLVYVGCNTVAAMHTNSEKAAAAFAGISAGTLSGLTIGAGLSSVLLSLRGWQLIYIAGAVITGIGVFLAMSSGDVRPLKGMQEDSGKHPADFREFMFSRRVIGFFVLLLLPFMMALSYREYFFPLVATEHGITEVRIGQLYLICGIVVIYAGPYLSEWILKIFGALWSVVLSSIAMGVNMLVYVIHPNMVSVVAGVVILSVLISFAYTCQYTYFEMTPESQHYGAGKSMGIYSVFESLGQTLGPVVYGSLLAFGYRKGTGIFCITLLVLAMTFAFLLRRDSAIYRTEEDIPSE